MKIAFDKKKFFFYLWVGLAFCLVWLIGVIVNEPAQFVVRSLNYLWAAIYLTVLNFIFFEYAIPYIRKKRKYILLITMVCMNQTQWFIRTHVSDSNRPRG